MLRSGCAHEGCRPIHVIPPIVPARRKRVRAACIIAPLATQARTIHLALYDETVWKVSTPIIGYSCHFATTRVCWIAVYRGRRPRDRSQYSEPDRDVHAAARLLATAREGDR